MVHNATTLSTTVGRTVGRVSADALDAVLVEVIPGDFTVTESSQCVH